MTRSLDFWNVPSENCTCSQPSGHFSVGAIALAVWLLSFGAVYDEMRSCGVLRISPFFTPFHSAGLSWTRAGRKNGDKKNGHLLCNIAVNPTADMTIWEAGSRKKRDTLQVTQGRFLIRDKPNMPCSVYHPPLPCQALLGALRFSLLAAFVAHPDVWCL